MQLRSRALRVVTQTLLAFLLAACGQSYEEKQHNREAERKKARESSQEELVKFGETYGAKPWRLSQLGFDSKFTAQVQEEIVGSTIAFRAHILDVVQRGDDDYELVVGDRLLGKDIVYLRSIRGGVAHLLTESPEALESYLFVAEIQRVEPLQLELRPCDEPDCNSVLLDPSMGGVTHRIVGRMVAIQKDDSRRTVRRPP
jgi:hypothetical protein